MKRIDIVVANFGRIQFFCENFRKLKNFDADNDRIIVLDCSPDQQNQLSTLATFCNELGLKKSIFFVRRSNWLLNHGAQLDYIHLLNSGAISRPLFCYFMQDHYLDSVRDVKGDSLPDNTKLDIDMIVDFHSKTHGNSVIFCSRDGFRVTRFVARDQLKQVYEHYKNLSAGRPSATPFRVDRDLSICIDGGNFCVDPVFLMNALRKIGWNSGPGTYNHAHVWETMLAYIHQKAECGFYELTRCMSVWVPEDLTQNEKMRASWKPFYAFPVAWALYEPTLCDYDFELCRRQVPYHLSAEIQKARNAVRWRAPTQIINLD